MFRRLIILAGVALLACALAAPALAVRVKVRVEGKTTTIYGAGRARAHDRPERASGARRGQHCRRVLLPRHEDRLRPVRRPDRSLPGAGFSGWSYKINGVSPPVGADQATVQDGDTVLWYWSTFSEQGGSPTLVLRKRAARNCYSVLSQNDQGVSTPATGARLVSTAAA